MSNDQPLCAHCAEPIDPDGPNVSVAMTSRNTCLLFHSECLADMHGRAYELTEDMHEFVLGQVVQAMDQDVT